MPFNFLLEGSCKELPEKKIAFFFKSKIFYEKYDVYCEQTVKIALAVRGFQG